MNGALFALEGFIMSILKIALLQLMPGADAAENREIGLRACREAKEMGADIALFPEMWSSGYRIPAADAERRELPVAADGPFVRAFREEAEKLRMAVGITYLERYDPLPRIPSPSSTGGGKRCCGTQRCTPATSTSSGSWPAGTGFTPRPSRPGPGVVQVGAMICFDREFPESARVLMLEGAELVLVPNACPMELNRLSQLRARAFENMMAVATCNYPAGAPRLQRPFDPLRRDSLGRGGRVPGLLPVGGGRGNRGFTWRRSIWTGCGGTGNGRFSATPTAGRGFTGALAEEAVRPPFCQGGREAVRGQETRTPEASTR